ncbi:MAG: HAD family hydrolase [Lachnospiraceae bacterium]
MEYKAIIFDFDYTLGDCTDGIVACVEYALLNMKCKMQPIEKIREAVGMTLEDTYTYLMDDDKMEQREEFTRLFKIKADDVMCLSAIFLPYAEEILKELHRRNILVGIVTTKYRFRIVDILEKLDAAGLVDAIIGSDNVAVAKPDPEGLKQIIHNFGLEKQQVLYVGDSYIDAQTAENAGVDFAGVTTGTTTKETFGNYKSILIMEDLRPILTMI